jgi:hypothetical protein
MAQPSKHTASPQADRVARRPRSPLAVLLSAALMVVAWSLVEPHTLAVTTSTMTSPRIPAGFDGTRVVFVSDVHAGPHFGSSRTARLIDRINALEPDLVILGGDYVAGHSNGADIFYPEATRLTAPLGVFAVLGNHESWEGAGTARARLAGANIRLLENETVLVEQDGSSISVSGVEDLQSGFPDVAGVASDVPASGFAILVSHNPDVFAEGLPAAQGVFDLALAGHLHGGQVTLLGKRALWVPSSYGERYRQSWLEESGTRVLVSRGVGTVHLPIRFFSPPELHVIDLKRGESALTTD